MNWLGKFFGAEKLFEENQKLIAQSRQWRKSAAEQAKIIADQADYIAELTGVPSNPQIREAAFLLERISKL